MTTPFSLSERETTRRSRLRSLAKIVIGSYVSDGDPARIGKVKDLLRGVALVQFARSRYSRNTWRGLLGLRLVRNLTRVP